MNVNIEIPIERIRNGIVADLGGNIGKVFFTDYDSMLTGITEDSRQEWAELRHMQNPPTKFLIKFSVEEFYGYPTLTPPAQ